MACTHLIEDAPGPGAASWWSLLESEGALGPGPVMQHTDSEAKDMARKQESEASSTGIVK